MDSETHRGTHVVPDNMNVQAAHVVSEMGGSIRSVRWDETPLGRQSDKPNKLAVSFVHLNKERCGKGDAVILPSTSHILGCANSHELRSPDALKVSRWNIVVAVSPLE